MLLLLYICVYFDSEETSISAGPTQSVPLIEAMHASTFVAMQKTLVRQTSKLAKLLETYSMNQPREVCFLSIPGRIERKSFS